MYTSDHTLIIKELEKSIKFNNWNSILSFLPKGSYLVGGYIRDIMLERVTEEIDIDIVVPFNAIEIGKKISDKIKSRSILKFNSETNRKHLNMRKGSLSKFISE